MSTHSSLLPSQAFLGERFGAPLLLLFFASSAGSRVDGLASISPNQFCRLYADHRTCEFILFDSLMGNFVAVLQQGALPH